MKTVTEIKQTLYQSLGKIGNIEEFALLDYPDYLNIGDHLIWLGTLFYFNYQIKYTASIKSFNHEIMNKKIGKQTPILLQGGGNLGDLWTDNQIFREQIISQYKHRKIIILPQSIYFADENNLKKAANIFNSHPELTIFVRDHYSYEIAINYFDKCQIILAPDMAFLLPEITQIAFSHPKTKILFHNRGDKEINQEIDLKSLQINNLVREDWISYQWLNRENITEQSPCYWKIPGTVKIYREVWQKRLKHPQEWISRQIWQNFHPNAAILKNIDHPSLHQKSWQLYHSALWQFSGYNLIITNRLHGHILCLLLEIPHIFLPNSYHKNEGFYQTWTAQINQCKFVFDLEEINIFIAQLNEEK
jgi:pyruvyl transferase EpsO